MHEWGEITRWEPPRRLGYLWYLRQDRADATQVEISFVDKGDGTTRVEIEHQGWDRLGAKGPELRRRNGAGWRGVLPHLIAACGGATAPAHPPSPEGEQNSERSTHEPGNHVRYQTTAEAAEENQRLVEQVYAELNDSKPDGLRYVTLRLADGVTFVHIAFVEGEENPLVSHSGVPGVPGGLPNGWRRHRRPSQSPWSGRTASEPRARGFRRGLRRSVVSR